MWYSSDWKEYELLDAADGQRLERWGKYVFVRPDPQAVWGDKSNNPLWKKADGRYIRSSSGGGQWQFFKTLPESWTITQDNYKFKIKSYKYWQNHYNITDFYIFYSFATTCFLATL